MTQYRVEHNKNYTVINNTIVTDSRLSWKAKGIWLYAFSRPDNWTFYKADIIKQSKDSDTSVDSGLKELENCGYLVRVRKRDEKGRLGESQWTFFETPKSLEELEKMGFTTKSEPKPDFPDQVNPEQENVPLTNTDFLLSIEKKQQTEQGASPPEPPSLPAAVVRCSLKEKLLKPYDFDEETLDDLCQHPIERIENALAALSQSQARSDIPNPKGWLRMAILKEWKPNTSAADVEKARQIEESRQKSAAEDRKSQAQALFDLHKNSFTNYFRFQTNSDLIQLKIKNGYCMLYYRDSDCIENLNKFIAQYLKG